MEGQMNKEQVIETTMNVLGSISVPVSLKDQIAVPIEGAINNMAIVLQMIRMENEANAQREERLEEDENGAEADPE